MYLMDWRLIIGIISALCIMFGFLQWYAEASREEERKSTRTLEMKRSTAEQDYFDRYGEDYKNRTFTEELKKERTKFEQEFYDKYGYEWRN
jgi:ABC-type multidrug transport system fused ATPase/permease subunit